MKIVFVAIFAIFALLVGGSSADNNNNDCLRVCPANYDPICIGTAAPSGEPYYTMGNQCAYEQYNCEHNNKYVVKFSGECP